MSASLFELPGDLLEHEIFPLFSLPCLISNKFVSRTFRKYATKFATKIINSDAEIMGDPFRCQNRIFFHLRSPEFSTRYLLWFNDVLKFPITQPHNCSLFVSVGDNLPLLQTIFKERDSRQFCDAIASIAAGTGNLDTLNWLCSIGAPICSSWFYEAAKNGHIEVIKWLLEKRIEVPADAPQRAAQAGKVEVLELFKEAKVRIPNLSGSVHKPVLEWMLANRYRVNPFFSTEIAATGNLSLLQWAVQHKNLGIRIDEYLCSSAALSGNLEMLRWLHEEKKASWDYDVAKEASHKGYLAILQYYVANAPPLQTTQLRNLPSYAAAGGHFEMLKWMCANGFQITLYTYKRVASCNSKNALQILQWLHANHPLEIDVSLMNTAAASGDLERVKWLHSIRVPIHNDTLNFAARTGNLDLCKWIAEAHPSSDLELASCTAAAWNWSLVLKWLVEKKRLLTADLWRAGKSKAHIRAILKRYNCPEG